MSIRKAIYDLLNDSEADVYPLIAPQELTDPYVVYSMRRTPVRTQDGVTVNDVELSLSIYANSLSDCIGLSRYDVFWARGYNWHLRNGNTNDKQLGSGMDII
jgi:hypothetical protein